MTFRPEVNKKRIQAYLGIVFKIDICKLDISVSYVKDVKDSLYMSESIGHQKGVQQQEIFQHTREKPLTSLTPSPLTPAVTVLKEKYDSWQKPDSIEDLDRLKKVMADTLLLEDIEGGEQYVNDYCQVRGWQ